LKQTEPPNQEQPIGEDFLHRWSRRKQESRDQEMVSAPGQVETHQGDPECPGDSDMPPLGSLTENSDYTGFLSPNVSDELHRLALRKLFHSAGFNQCDGLDDYDDDFRSFKALGAVLTADLRHRMALEAEKQNAAEKNHADRQASEHFQDKTASASQGSPPESRSDVSTVSSSPAKAEEPSMCGEPSGKAGNHG
jgi:hypothetical protein